MKSIKINTLEKDFGKRLDVILKERCINFSRNKLSSFIKSNKVKVSNKIISDPAFIIKKKLEISLNLEPIKLGKKLIKKEFDIIFEDNYIIIINKAAGVLSHLNKENDYNNLSVVSGLKKRKINLYKAENSLRDGIVHRLDKDTTGLMVLAKNAIGYESLVRQFHNRKVFKLYDALCWGVPQPLAGKIDRPITEYLNRKKVSMDNTGKKAITEYSVKKNFKNIFSLCECRILTGRTHQIRVHMQSIKCPLVGDQLYSRDRNISKTFSKKFFFLISRFRRQALHSKELSFVHPIKKKKVSFKCEQPQDMVNLEKTIFDEIGIFC